MMNRDRDGSDRNLIEYQTNRLQELIADLHGCCQDRIYQEARRFGLPPAEIKCLLLFQGYKYLTAIEIAGMLEVAKSRATVILDGLEGKKLIRRDPDPADARVKLTSLTPQGLKKVQEIEEFIFSLHVKFLTEIEPEQRAGVVSALETLTLSMDMVKKQLQRQKK